VQNIDPRETDVPLDQEKELMMFMKRFAAALIDGIVILVLSYIGAVVIGGVVLLVMGESESIQRVPWLVGPPEIMLVNLILAWIYMAKFESSERQASPGKSALGIMVTDMNDNRISFGRATGRHFAKNISALILLIGFLMAAFTKRGQALHDLIAGCEVVERR